MNHIPPTSLPPEVAKRTSEMVHSLGDNHWADMTETQQGFIAALYYVDADQLTVAQARDVAILYGMLCVSAEKKPVHNDETEGAKP